MKIQRPGLQEFTQQVEAGAKSIYLKAGEDFEVARRLRIIPWVFNGAPIDIMMLQEGWHEVKVKNDKGKEEIKSKPIRFLPGVEIPEGITWSMSSGNAKIKPSKQTPKPNIYFLAYDYKTQELKLGGFYHTGVLGPITSMMSQKNKDGSDNESYVEDFTAVDILIHRMDEKKWSVTTSEKNGAALSKDIIKAMSTFKWDWAAFLAGESPHEDDAPGFDEVAALIGGDDAPEAKPMPKQEPKAEPKKEASNNTSDDWKSVKTPGGLILGQQTIEQLQTMKKTMDEHKNASKMKEGPLYKAIAAGIAELSSSNEEQSEEDGEETALF